MYYLTQKTKVNMGKSCTRCISFNTYICENMNIVERVGYIHLTRLAENSQAAKAYQSTINLYHLIHELGHAWSSQKA